MGISNDSVEPLFVTPAYCPQCDKQQVVNGQCQNCGHPWPRSASDE